MERTILMATSNPFWRRGNGSQHRIASLICGLRPEFDLRVLFAGRLSEADRKALNAFGSLQVDELDYEPNVPFPSASIEDFASPTTATAFQSIVERMRPDIILIQYIRLAFLVESLSPELRQATTLAIDTHDIMHERDLLFREKGYAHWINITREQEADVLSMFDVVIAIQSANAATLRAMVPSCEVVETPYSIQPEDVTRRPKGAPVTFGYIGAPCPPNDDALHLLTHEIWPWVCEQTPDQPRLLIAGEISLHPTVKDRRIDWIGPVDRVRDFYSQIDAVVNPVRIGSGLKIKNVEALAHGRPVITTSHGAKGLEAGIGTGVFVADNPDSIADRMIELTQDTSKREQASRDALTFVRDTFAPDVVYQNLCACLHRHHQTPTAEEVM